MDMHRSTLVHIYSSGYASPPTLFFLRNVRELSRFRRAVERYSQPDGRRSFEHGRETYPGILQKCGPMSMHIHFPYLRSILLDTSSTYFLDTSGHSFRAVLGPVRGSEGGLAKDVEHAY